MTTKSKDAIALEKVRVLLEAQGLDAVLLRKRRSFSWVTGGRDNYIVQSIEGGVADLLIFADRKYCITTKMESARIGEEELAGLGYEMVAPEWYEGPDAAITRLTAGKRIGVDVPPVTVGGLDQAALAVDLIGQLAELSYVLTKEEITAYRELCQTAAKALEATCREITPGMTEYEISAVLAPKVIAQGIRPQVILVATDERIYKYRHPIPTAKKLERYAMLVICAERGGLVANVTRFVHFGKLSDELKVNKHKLAHIDLAMNLATRPGTAIADVFQAALDAYAAAGYGEDWRFLHQGGPTGYASREFLATPGCAGTVQLHQAFAWNPAIRGIKSEDTMLVGEQGNEFLTHTGEWDYIKIEHNGHTYVRPDILVR